MVSTIDKEARPDRPEIAFHVSGVADEEAVNWVRQTLAVGDRVEIRVIDTEKVDVPRKIEGGGFPRN